MIVELLKNIKQAAIGHALSATMVVQGVALQQMTMVDFSHQEAHLNEIILEQKEDLKSQSQGNFDNENYWKEIEEIADASYNQDLSQGPPALVGELYEEYEPAKESVAETNNGSQITGPLVASNFGVTVSSGPSVGKSVSNSSQPSSSPQPGAAGGGQNNISAQAVAEAISANRNPASSQESGSDKPELVTNDPSSRAARDFKDTSGASLADTDEEEASEEGDEEDQEEVSFEYLGTLVLVRNGDEEVQVINDQDELSLDPNAEYSIKVVTDNDFGSVNFSLENRDNNDVHTAQENQIPFSLNGDFGPENTLRAFDFESAQYQLDLRAYDSNGQGGEVLETRTVRFSITFSD